MFKDKIRIAVKGKQTKMIVQLRIISFVDKQTKQHLEYIPALDMSAYGKTAAKAKAMMQDSIDTYFTTLVHLPVKEIKAELAKYGWKQEPYHNKNYSHAYVDVNGVLQGIDAIDIKESELQHEALATA